MNNNSAILQHIWDTSWNLGPAASNCKRAQDRFFSTSGQRPARSSPSRGKVTLRGGVSHRRGRPVDDPDRAEALLGWSRLTMEEAMEWGRHISHPPVPGTWRPGALLQPPTHVREHQQVSSTEGRAMLPRHACSREQGRRGSWARCRSATDWGKALSSSI
jgi:hypothetical protein